MRIFAFHLLNDYSGSPKVLSQLIKGWHEHGLEVHVCSSFENNGFLSDIPSQVTRRNVWYRFYENKLVRLFALLLSQLMLIVRLFSIVKHDDIIYVNTVLPFGGALLGRLKGCRVIYHIHETTMKPPVLKRFLFGVVKMTSQDVVYVSHFLANEEPIAGKKTHVLHNAIPDAFVGRAEGTHRDKTMPQHVLMVCSLKSYKGVHEFVMLAKRLSEYRFRMVINAPLNEIDSFFKGTDLPPNLELFPTQQDVVPHYAWADLVVNLSHPDGWVETFGLTIIEGMAFGLPAIVPPVGGITEVIDHGVNGYHMNPHDIDGIADTIENMFTNRSEYQSLSENTRIKLEEFREKAFFEGSLNILGV
jgi:glycosyltransferase involved in cell wall biosynthesis